MGPNVPRLRFLLDDLIEQERAEGQAEVVLQLLTRKFGPLDQAVIAQVRAASLEELDRYAERLLAAQTLEDVIG